MRTRKFSRHAWLQGMYRCWAARRALRARVAAVVHKMFDVASGYPYYFNTLSGASTWTKPLPRVLGDSDLEMTPRSVAAVLAAFPPNTARTAVAVAAFIGVPQPARLLQSSAAAIAAGSSSAVGAGGNASTLVAAAATAAAAAAPSVSSAATPAVGDGHKGRSGSTGKSLRPKDAACVIQCAYRCRLACAEVRRRVFETYGKTWEPSMGVYYYWNAVTGATQWTKPLPYAMGSYDLPVT